MRIIDSRKSVRLSVHPSVLAVVIVAPKGGDASQSDIICVARSHVCMCVRAREYVRRVLCPMCGSRGARCVVGMLSAAGSRVAHCYSLGLAFACLSGLPSRPAVQLARSIPF